MRLGGGGGGGGDTIRRLLLPLPKCTIAGLGSEGNDDFATGVFVVSLWKDGK